jgi:hypothetical protein
MVEKYTALSNGKLVTREATVESTGSINAGEIIALGSDGKLSGTLIGDLSRNNLYTNTTLNTSASTINVAYVDEESTPVRTITLPVEDSGLIHINRNSSASYTYSTSTPSISTGTTSRRGWFNDSGTYFYFCRSAAGGGIYKVNTSTEVVSTIATAVGGWTDVFKINSYLYAIDTTANTVKVYSLIDDSLVTTYSGFTGSIYTLALSFDGSKIWVAGQSLHSVNLTTGLVTLIGSLSSFPAFSLIDLSSEIVVVSDVFFGGGGNVRRVSVSDASTIGYLLSLSGSNHIFYDGSDRFITVGPSGINIVDLSYNIINSYSDTGTGSFGTTRCEVAGRFLYYAIDNNLRILEYPSLSLVKSFNDGSNTRFGGIWDNNERFALDSVQRIITTVNPSESTTPVVFHKQVSEEATVTVGGTYDMDYLYDSLTFVSASGEYIASGQKYGLVPASSFLSNSGWTLLPFSYADLSGVNAARGTPQYLTGDLESELPNSRQFQVDSRLLYSSNELILDDPYYSWHSRRDPSTTLTTIDTTGTSLTPTPNGTASSVTDNDGAWIQYLSSTTVNTEAGWSSASFTHTQTQFSPRLTFTIKTGPNSSDLENIRMWIGLFSASPTASDNPAIHLAALRYATSSDGTAFWRTCTKDGTTMNAQTSSISISTNTVYVVKIYCTASEVKFYINNTLAGTHTTNLPTSTTGLNYFCILTNLLGGTGRRILINGISGYQR